MSKATADAIPLLPRTILKLLLLVMVLLLFSFLGRLYYNKTQVMPIFYNFQLNIPIKCANLLCLFTSAVFVRDLVQDNKYPGIFTID